MTATIHTKDEYLDALKHVIHGGDSIVTEKGDFVEVSKQLEFLDCDLTDLAPTGYPQEVWNTITNVMINYPVTAAQSTNLNYYNKAFGTWMNAAACTTYGDNFRNQLPNVIAQFKSDLSTRRAVIVQSWQECLTSVQWQLFDFCGKSMFICLGAFRSLDAMHVPTDLFMLTKLTDMVLEGLGIQVDVKAIGMNVGNFHIYAKDAARL